MTVERWTGNGGQMAKSKQKLAEEELRIGIAEGTQPPRKAGVKKLCRAAGRAIGAKTKDITELLVRKTLSGDLRSAKMLIALGEPQQMKKKVNKKGKAGMSRRTAAMRLSDEPEWVETVAEENAETGFGGQEPEG